MTPFTLAAVIITAIGLTVDNYHRWALTGRDLAPAALAVHNAGLFLTFTGSLGLGIAIPHHPWWAGLAFAYTVGSFLHGIDLRRRVHAIRRLHAATTAAAATGQSLLDAAATIYSTAADIHRAVCDLAGPPPLLGATVTFRLADSDLATALDPDELDQIVTGEVVHISRDMPEVGVLVDGWPVHHTVRLGKLFPPLEPQP